MLKKLTHEQRRWVESTLRGMSLEEKVGQLIEVADRRWPVEEWKSVLNDVPMGMVILDFCADLPQRQVLTRLIQDRARTPVLIGTDMESGPGAVLFGKVGAVAEATAYPAPLACGAVGDPRLMKLMGRCTAVEARHHGVHCALAPVLDLDLNVRNLMVSRSLGDDPDRVSRLVVPWIQGMQEGGHLAATGKHFPGDGMDDRDQHLCTATNNLSVEEWFDTYGRVWKSAIRAGLLTAMVGHISFPAWEGCADHPWDALPGSLSRRVIQDLLRGELGFEGLIMSDAATMGGMTTRFPSNELAIRNIQAGSDVYLCFDDPRPHYRWLLEAVHTGVISEERVESSARCMLELKARLGLQHDVYGPAPTKDEMAAFEAGSVEMAERSLTLLRADHMTPVHLEPGAKVLTVTIHPPNPYEADPVVVDEELRARGFQVEHLTNPSHRDIMARMPDVDCVFLNLSSSWRRFVGEMTGLWYSWWVDDPKVVFTSFGSPYLIYDLPHAPNMWLTYNACEQSQRAVVKAWLGEREPEGRCPVVIPLAIKRAEVIQAVKQATRKRSRGAAVKPDVRGAR